MKIIENESFVAVPGGKVWYKIVYSDETKNNIPLIILHGGPGFPHNYLEVFKAIAKKRPVIFYDQLGCGHSVIPNQSKTLWNLDRYITELEVLIAHLKLQFINLLGHSWGGTLALEYALKQPEKVSGLILASPLLSSKLWIEDTRRLITELPQNTQSVILQNEKSGTTDSLEYKNAMDIFNQRFVFRIEEWPDQLKYSFAHFNFDIYTTMWGASEFTVTGNLKDYDRINDLHKLNMPVLMTCGRFDEATPATLLDAVKLLKRGELIIYEDSAHFAFLSEKYKYLNSVNFFLDSLKADCQINSD